MRSGWPGPEVTRRLDTPWGIMILTVPIQEEPYVTHQQMLGLVDVNVPASGPAYWRAVWSGRHTAVAIVAGAALFAALVSARQATGAADYVLLGLAAVVGAVTLATYVPPTASSAREHLTGGGACAVMPVLVVLGAPVILSQAAATLTPLMALLIFYGFAAGKRITAHASC